MIVEPLLLNRRISSTGTKLTSQENSSRKCITQPAKRVRNFAEVACKFKKGLKLSLKSLYVKKAVKNLKLS
jgi:hypothetical protein